MKYVPGASKMTFWFPIWISLNLSNGSLNYPKKGTKNCQYLELLQESARLLDKLFGGDKIYPPWWLRPWTYLEGREKQEATDVPEHGPGDFFQKKMGLFT